MTADYYITKAREKARDLGASEHQLESATIGVLVSWLLEKDSEMKRAGEKLNDLSTDLYLCAGPKE